MTRYRRFLMPVTSVAQGTRKYNRGHYVAIERFMWQNALGQDSGAFVYPFGSGNFSQSGVPGGHLGTSNYPGIGNLVRNTDGPASLGVRGIQMPYFWSELEPSQGAYDFTRLIADLATCKRLGIQLVIQIVERTFQPSQNPAPGAVGTYLNQLPYTTPSSGSGGFQMSRWDSTVQAKFKLLVEAIGNKFDSDPNFEGIATQETSTGLTAAEQTATNYSASAYLAGLQFEADCLATAIPTSRHFGYQNFIADSTTAAGDAKVDIYALYLPTKQAILGGPDILPDDAGLQSRVYPHYTHVHTATYPNNGPISCSAQDASFTQALRSMYDLYLWCTGNTLTGLPTPHEFALYTDYLFWTWHYTGGGPHFFNPDARDVIANNPNFGSYSPPGTPAPTYIYVDLNAGVNGSGLSPSSPVNILPTTLADNTTILFNSENGIQTMPIRSDCLYLNGSNCTVGTYGTSKAVLSGFRQFTSGWTLDSGTVYHQTITPGAGAIGCVMNMSNFTESPEGTVMNWTDMTVPAGFVPATLPSGSYAFDATNNIMYVNVGANANTVTIGVSACARMFSVQPGNSPSNVTVNNLRIIGFSRSAVSVLQGANNWRVTRNQFYANGGNFNAGYVGSGITISHNANNIEVDNNLIEQTYDSPITPQHFAASAGENIHDINIHNNTISKWGLAAFEISDFSSTNVTNNVTVAWNIATGGGAGFCGVGTHSGVTDGIQLRGANNNCTGLNFHDNTLQTTDGAVYVHAGTMPGGIILNNNRLSSSKYGLRNLQSGVSIASTNNQYCANSIADRSDAGAGSTSSGDTFSGSECYITPVPGQGIQ